MKNNSNCFNSEKLDYEIALLEAKQIEDFINLKDQLNDTFEKFTSATTIKNILHKLADNAELKNESIALAAGYISEKIFIGKSESKFKLTIGKVIQNMVTTVIANCFAPYKD
jgi:proline dehydrogenase